MKVKIYKCYEVVVEDSDGNTLASEYYYGSRTGAEEDGRLLKKMVKGKEEQA